MTASLLVETKLLAGFVAPGLLPRRHLMTRLLEAQHARLVVVHSEAGAGKTSLLSTFTRESRRPVAWYALQDSDRDPRVFLTYLCETLQRTFPGTAARSRELLDSAAAVPDGWQPLITTLSNDLTRYGNPVTLVLDDYHLVADVPEIAAIVSFMVRNSPPNQQLILATRMAPDLPLPWLRAKNMLLELGSDDLRFSVEEVSKVFAEAWGQPIDPDVAELLTDRTEGWVTGLQLVSQAIRARSELDVRSYVLGLGGKQQFIYDYLATEVYALHPPEVRSFLKKTSLPARFNADLARSMTELDNVEQMLELLDANRLFLVHLDTNQEWFRYHHLFGEFLRRRLQVEDGASVVRALHLRAGTWFETHHDPAAAMSHLVAAQDMDSVVRVLEQDGTLLMAQGLHHSVGEWLDMIPSPRRNRPQLDLLRGQLHELGGEWGPAVGLYERALERFRKDGQEDRAAAVVEAILMCHMQYADIDTVVGFCESALAACAPEDLVHRSSISSRYGAALVISGRDWDRGYQLISEAYDLAYKSGDARAIGWACVFNGFCHHFIQGRFSLAEKIFNEGLELLNSMGWFPMVYQVLMNKCVVLIFQGDLPRARDLIEDTMALAERAGQAFVMLGLEMNRAKLYLEMGDYHACAAAFSRMTERLIPSHIKPWYYRTLLLLHVHQDNMEQARAVAREMLRFMDVGGYGMYAPECLVSLAWYHHRAGDPTEARRVVEQALTLSRRAHSCFWEMKSHMLRATLLRQDRGHGREARDSLEAALSLSRDHDFTNTWLTDSLHLAVPLLVAALSANVEVEYARNLLARYGDDRLAPRLTALAGEGNYRLRSAAIALLGPLGAPEANRVLREAKTDPARLVRTTVRRTLRERPATPVHVEMVTLGRFEIRRGGEPVVFGRRLTQRLFKYLVAHYDRLMTNDQLVDAFWSDMDHERARRNLAVHVNFIRTDLRPDAGRGPRFFVSREPDGLTVRLDSTIRLDVVEFDRLVEEGRRLLEEGNRETATAKFLRAESLCTGPFLPDDLDEAWLLARRERTAEQYRESILFLGDHAVAQGQWAEGASWYKKQIERDPLDEGVLQHLLRCYALLRDISAAHREFDRFRRKLEEELHREPSHQTRLLIERPELQD